MQGVIAAQGLRCCGWGEIYPISYYDGDFKGAMQYLLNYGMNRGAVLFTSAGYRATYASKFAKDVLKAELGEIITLPRFRNPNTGRIIKSYVWVIDHKALNAYAKSIGRR